MKEYMYSEDYIYNNLHNNFRFYNRKLQNLKKYHILRKKSALSQTYNIINPT